MFICGCKHPNDKEKEAKRITIFHYPPDMYFVCYTFSEVIYKVQSNETHYLTSFFVTKHACLFCIFVVIRCEGHKLESKYVSQPKSLESRFRYGFFGLSRFVKCNFFLNFESKTKKIR